MKIWGCKLEKMAQEEAEKRADKNDCDAKTYLQSHRSIEINETSKGLATILFVQGYINIYATTRAFYDKAVGNLYIFSLH